jgi:hypothetical protein
MNNKLLLAHMGLCFFMTGLIWTIQVVHYPTFRYVDSIKFTDFSLFHGKSITPITALPMILEFVTGALLLFYFRSALTALNFAFIILIWMSTFFLSVPIHNQLAVARDEALIEKLILTNWPRTILWTLRSGLLLWMMK